jgi:hypothetical protein
VAPPNRHNLITQAGLFTALAAAMEKTNSLAFDSTVLDEAQDVSIPQLRFLAALGATRPDALSFAGDLGQHTFQQPLAQRDKLTLRRQLPAAARPPGWSFSSVDRDHIFSLAFGLFWSNLVVLLKAHRCLEVGVPPKASTWMSVSTEAWRLVKADHFISFRSHNRASSIRFAFQQFAVRWQFFVPCYERSFLRIS